VHVKLYPAQILGVAVQYGSLEKGGAPHSREVPFEKMSPQRHHAIALISAKHVSGGFQVSANFSFEIAAPASLGKDSTSGQYVQGG